MAAEGNSLDSFGGHGVTRLQQLLGTASGKGPEALAIRSGKRDLTYAQLDRLVQRIAAGLQSSGVRPGDRVAWLMPNCVEAVAATLGCYQIGAIAVPLNYRYVADEILAITQRIDPVMLLFWGDRAESVQAVLQTRPDVGAFAVAADGMELPAGVSGFDSLLGAGSPGPMVEVEEGHPALMLFTSGSTGRPKGVVHSHASAFAAIETSRRIFDFSAEDVVLVGKPISHAGGLQTQLLPALMVGALVLLEMRPSPARAVEIIAAQAVTEYGMLASDLLDFVEYLEANPVSLPSLNNGIGSGDAVPTDLHHRFRDLLGWEIMEGAGMTEIGGYYAVNPRYGQRKWGSLGLPTPGTDLSVVGADGQDCAVGDTGEILLKTEAPLIGYWQDSEATRKLFSEGWLRTGDLGHLDEDGYVWFVGRRKLMIVRRGSNIAPAEVENVLDEHPLVHASVVVGLDDPRDGQIPVACVALRQDQGTSVEQQIRDYVSQHLAGYKNPVYYLYFDELPRTMTGKYDRHLLQEIAAERLTVN